MRALRALFQPESVAVIGASAKVGSLGSVVLESLHAGGFKGAVLPVHPRYRACHRLLCYKSVDALPLAPDLAVLCTPAAGVAEELGRLGERGTKVAVVMANDPDGHAPDTPLKKALGEVARVRGIRVLGPASSGIQVPLHGLDASGLGARTAPGRLALVSQSNSIAAAVVDWAAGRGIGFSSVVTTGDGVDIDLPELLDYLAADVRTRAVLLYVRRIADGRAFLSAARALSRIKPILVLRPHDLANPLSNQIHDAAFRRAGMLPVADAAEWFDAVESLGYGKFPAVDKLAILGNGCGPGQLAAAIVAAENRLACPDETILSQGSLKSIAGLSRGPANPLDLGRDADPPRYLAAMQAMLADPGVGSLLVTYTPSPLAPPEAVARVVAEAVKQTQRQVIACWLGRGIDGAIHQIFTEAAVPVFDTPEKAARAFLHLVRYRDGQAALMQIPTARPSRRDQAEQGLLLQDETETRAILQAYGTVARHVMMDEPDIGGADSLAILSAYGFKTDAGVAANLPLALSVSHDPVFGRAIVIEAAGRRTVALPPLNTALARPVIEEILPPLQAAVNREVDGDPLAALLVQIADLLVELPEVTGLSIPSLALAQGMVILPAALLRVEEAAPHTSRLSIAPYPRHLEERLRLRNGVDVLVRPIRPEDEPHYRDMLEKVSPGDRFLRFCTRFGDEVVPPELLAKLIQIDYSRDMSFIAIAEGADGKPEALGVVDAMGMSDRTEMEYSIILRSDLKGAGLGKALMEKIIAYARSQGALKLVGMVLRNNQGMRGLCTRLGFSTKSDPEDDMVTVTLTL